MKKFILLFIAGLLVGCTSQSEPQTNNKTPQSQDNLTTSIDLADHIYEKQHENLLFSPLSLNFALGIVADGASGKTKDEINAYLNTTDYSQFASYYLQNINQRMIDHKEVHLEIADGLFSDHKITIKEDYIQTIQSKYKGICELLDFKDKVKTSKYINNWVDEKTHHMIKEIVDPDSLTDEGMLVNTLYFNAPWEKFWVAADKMIFKDLDGNNQTTTRLIGAGDQYFENDQAIAFQKKYLGGFSLYGILPKEEGEFTLDELHIQNLISEPVDNVEVSCAMPRLNYEQTIELTDLLIDAGIPTVFSNEADLSGITESLWKVESVMQKTKIELDENGTKASSATTVTFGELAAPVQKEIKEVILNRPFAYLIYDDINHQVLFIGKVIQL